MQALPQVPRRRVARAFGAKGTKGYGMTVIAWDGKTLAADRRRSTEYGMIDEVTKCGASVTAAPDSWPYLWAISGKAAIALELLEWFHAGQDPFAFPASARGGDATLVIIDDEGACFYTRGPIAEPINRKIWATGTGGDLAIGAMHCGKTAREAVEIASIYCAWCGNGVDAFSLDPTIQP